MPSYDATRSAVSHKLLDAWIDCVKKSYRIQEALVPDKNEAAERAMSACKSEEVDLRTFDAPSGGELFFPHLRSQVKVVVIGNQ